MEYDPKQLEILMKKVAFTLGRNLEGLLFQQKNILDNQLNNLMIDHNGQADSITPDEIIGAYEIATIHRAYWKNYKSGKMPVDESYSLSAISILGSDHSSIFAYAVSYEVFECHNA